MVNDMIRPSVPNQNMGYLWGFGSLNFLIQCHFLVASEPEKSPIFQHFQPYFDTFGCWRYQKT